MKSTRNLFRLVFTLLLGASLATGSRAAAPLGPIQQFQVVGLTGVVSYFATHVYTGLNFVGLPLGINPNFGTQTFFFRPGPFADGEGIGSSATSDNGDSVLAVYSGKLTLKLPNGESFEIKSGQGAAFDKTGAPKGSAQSLTTLMENPLYKTMLLGAAKSTAAQLAANTDSSKTAELTRALAAIVQTLSDADPAAAKLIVETTVDELTKGGKSDEATLKSISIVIAAAVNGSEVGKETLTNAALAAAAKNNATGVTTTALADANVQKSLGGVFGSDTSSEAIDITIPVVSPSSP